MAHRLAHMTLEQEVVGSNPSGGGFQKYDITGNSTKVSRIITENCRKLEHSVLGKLQENHRKSGHGNGRITEN